MKMQGMFQEAVKMGKVAWAFILTNWSTYFSQLKFLLYYCADPQEFFLVSLLPNEGVSLEARIKENR